MEDDDYIMEGDEDFIVESDGGDVDADDEEIEIENKFYTMKTDKEDENPDAALQGYMEIIDQDTSRGKWTFKSLKHSVRCLFRLKRYKEAVEKYKELIAFEWNGQNRNKTEKMINQNIDLAAQAGPEVLQQVIEATLGAVNDGKAGDKLWFNAQSRLAQLHFDRRDSAKLKQMATELKNWCKDADTGKVNEKKGISFLNISSLELQMLVEEENWKMVRPLFHQCLEVAEAAIPPPKIMGAIFECGGKMYMKNEEWSQANTTFFNAFKSYDEAGHVRRVECLKYLVLANMLSTHSINPFDSPEAKPYASNPEVAAMTELLDAYTEKDIGRFESVLKANKKTIMEEPFIKQYLTPLWRQVRCNTLKHMITPYKRLRISFIAQHLGLKNEEVEEMVAGLIIDNEMVGYIDQVNGLLVLGDSTSGDRSSIAKYNSLQKWSSLLKQATSLTETIHMFPSHDMGSFRSPWYDLEFGSSSRKRFSGGMESMRRLVPGVSALFAA